MELQWNQPQDQSFEAGLDRGVIYLDSGEAVSWSGLASVDDSGESTTQEFYIDGIKYLATVSPREWAGSLEAYTYPPAFGELIGVSQLGDGLFVDGQAHDRFGLSYRTMVSTQIDTVQHYKIHLIYKVMASLSSFTNETLTSGGVDPIAFQFDLSAVPIKIPGHRPSAHIIIDTRTLDDVTRAELEGILYGTSTSEPTMPEIEDLIDMLEFGDEVIVVDNHDGTWTATGSASNVYLWSDGIHFGIDNVGAEYLTPKIYKFFGFDEGEPGAQLSVSLDTDGVPYYQLSESTSNTDFDTDGVLFYSPGADVGEIVGDTDGTPYIDL